MIYYTIGSYFIDAIQKSNWVPDGIRVIIPWVCVTDNDTDDKNLV